MIEDRLLSAIDAERALRSLSDSDRAMMQLIYRVLVPEDWGRRPWPPNYKVIGEYVGRKFQGGPLSEAAIRYRRDVVLAFWAGERGQLRRNRRRIDLQKGK